MPTTPDRPAGPDDVSARVLGLFVAITRRYNAESEAAAAHHELTPLQAKALLAAAQPVPMRAVADKLHAEPSNVTAVVDRLEERGLVERRPAPGDRRVKLVAATDAGHAAIAGLRAAMPFAADPLGALDHHQREVLADLLALVVGQEPAP
ncbi:DNA-binding MarR family transcriptional regulator [Kitasatospora sp. MAP12-15]|uniref:MarR family winged helix-turn-helix transcriptional regulator n=1 Tax=unclassified Kitasatospora TaxID=2633591 RepID=UPI002473D2F2|nr:MarR family transcriptional regulator [Kitasatospora sp. MAP12-44]MDH6114796.1 DNA-binding MarR family transcriptional regulator [Kitasatospora sp. MAP12-44]